MLSEINELIKLYYSNEFLSCIDYTVGRTGFRAELIEKDFLCSLILMHIYKSTNTHLVFKGGTLLSKTYADFYRMSEDLDFSISVPTSITRQQRRHIAKPLKSVVNEIPKSLPIFNIEKPLAGTNESRQYNATLTYQSHISASKGSILFEVALREEHLQTSVITEAKTILSDFLSHRSMVAPFSIQCFNKLEAYAEKMRAALTRPLPAIRDFYDLSYAHHHKLISFDDPDFIELVKLKLSVSGVGSADLSENKYNFLKGKIKTELLPTLKEEADDFNLEKIFSLLKSAENI